MVLLRVRWVPWIDRLLDRTEKLLKDLGRSREAADLRAHVGREIDRAKKEEERLRRARAIKPMGDID